MARVSGEGVGTFLPLPLPLPPLSFFASRFISRAAKTENLVPLLRNSTETLAMQAKFALISEFKFCTNPGLS